MAKKKAASRRTSKKAGQLRVVDRPSEFKGIQELVWVDRKSLTRNPENWKHHPKEQVTALDANIASVGWAGVLLYNLETGRLIDGHGREERDRRQDWEKLPDGTEVVPVAVGRWSLEEERQILLNLDPLGAMFETDSEALRQLSAAFEQRSKELTESSEVLNTEQAKALEDLSTRLSNHATLVEMEAVNSFLPNYDLTPEPEDPLLDDEVEDVRIDDIPTDDSISSLLSWEEMPYNAFGEGGPFGIPQLRDFFVQSEDIPDNLRTWAGPETPDADAYFYIYGSAAIEKVRSNRLITGFFTEDRKFEAIFPDPSKFTIRMKKLGVIGACMPDFSIWNGCPHAFEIWQIYRARWVARYWQEAGIRIIVGFALANMDDTDRFNLKCWGIPEGAPIAIQCHCKGETDPETYYAVQRVLIRKMVRRLKPSVLLVYHGNDMPSNHVADLPADTRVVKVRTFMSERAGIIRGKDYLK